MILYASTTDTKKNLAALKKHGWRLLISRTSASWNTKDFAYALDNGAWSDYQQGKSFDGGQFTAMLEQLGKNADWVVAPDIVAQGPASLRLTRQWLPLCHTHCRRVLVAVQDGINFEDVYDLVGPTVGIFLGGSTEYKLWTMQAWGDFCRRYKCYYHVGRVNTKRRIEQAIQAGADSIDGTSATIYSKTTASITRWSKSRSLLAP